jgi:uncharacterized coiled-coil protein SlyX
MVGQQHSISGLNKGSANRLNGTAAETQPDDYSLILADRRVEDATRRVAEQIRIVSEIEAADQPSGSAIALLQELEQELKLLTEQREAMRPQALDDQPEEREAG